MLPKQKTEGEFDVIYIKHTSRKHDKWDEGKQRKREVYKKCRSQNTRDGENSTENSGSRKSLTLSSQMKSELFTDYIMSKDKITEIIGLYNQSNSGYRIRHSPENGLR